MSLGAVKVKRLTTDLMMNSTVDEIHPVVPVEVPTESVPVLQPEKKVEGLLCPMLITDGVKFKCLIKLRHPNKALGDRGLCDFYGELRGEELRRCEVLKMSGVMTCQTCAFYWRKDNELMCLRDGTYHYRRIPYQPVRVKKTLARLTVVEEELEVKEVRLGGEIRSGGCDDYVCGVDKVGKIPLGIGEYTRNPKVRDMVLTFLDRNNCSIDQFRRAAREYRRLE